MNNNSKTFCLHPFTGLATREDGAVKVCCRSQPIGWIQDDTLENIWNGPQIREVRRQVLCGERPEVCKPCFDLEDQGVESLRQRHIKNTIPESRVNLYPNALAALRDDYTMPFEFPTMEIKLNNLCIYAAVCVIHLTAPAGQIGTKWSHSTRKKTTTWYPQ